MPESPLLRAEILLIPESPVLDTGVSGPHNSEKLVYVGGHVCGKRSKFWGKERLGIDNTNWDGTSHSICKSQNQ